MEVYGTVLNVLAEAHRHVADQTDLDLSGDSRPAAMWIVAGRCIGGARAALTLLAAGFGAESTTPERTVHEATRLLAALTDPEETDIANRWIADRDKTWVRPREARDAQQRGRARIRDGLVATRDAARAAGDLELASQIDDALELPGLQEGLDVKPMVRGIYDVLSRIGHSRRSGIRDAVSPELREMATGPHPDPKIRAEYVEYGGLIVEEVVVSVGDALARFYGKEWYLSQIKPLIDQLGQLREIVPLTGLLGARE